MYDKSPQKEAIFYFFIKKIVQTFAHLLEIPYLCIVFFMVLDLR